MCSTISERGCYNILYRKENTENAEYTVYVNLRR